MFVCKSVLQIKLSSLSEERCTRSIALQLSVIKHNTNYVVVLRQVRSVVTLVAAHVYSRCFKARPRQGHPLIASRLPHVTLRQLAQLISMPR